MTSTTQSFTNRPVRSRTASDGLNRIVNVYSDADPASDSQMQPIMMTSSSSSSSTSATGFYSSNPATIATPATLQSMTTSAVPLIVNSAANEEASATSRASSSRLINVSSPAHISSSSATSSSARQMHQPLSLAQVLSRNGHDKDRALDEILADRNKLCLETNKLGTENIRIWNLVRRIKKENEELKATSKIATTSNQPSSSHLSASSYAMIPSLSSNSQELHQSFSTPTNLSSTTQVLLTPLSKSPSFASSSNFTSSTLQPRDLENASRSADAIISSGNHAFFPPPTSTEGGSRSRNVHDPPPTLITTNFANEDYSQYSPNSPSSSAMAGHEVMQSPQQTSIMKQRAAAQAQRLATLNQQSQLNGSHTSSSRRASLESQEFEAVESSSAADSDIGRRYSEGEDDPNQTKVNLPNSSTTAVNSIITPTQEKRPMAAPPTPERRGSSSLRTINQSSKSTVSPFAPRLDTASLSNISIAIIGTNFKPNERSKEDVAFYIDVDVIGSRSNIKSWRVEKLFSAFVALDARLKQKYSKSKSSVKQISGAQLPDRSLFKDHAPGKVDQRKIMLEVYLQNLLAISLPDKGELCHFLSTDAKPIKLKDPEAITKEGFLTKKGANLGRWVTRLYILNGSILEYYESRGGPQLGVISIIGAQIGRQQRSVNTDMDENSYRHAFLILESKTNGSEEGKQMIRHVLCAESDEERDEWVDVLVRAIASLPGQAIGMNGNQIPPSQRSFSTSSSTGVTGSPATPTAKKIGLPEGFKNNDTRPGSSPLESRQSPRKNTHPPRHLETPLFSSSGQSETAPSSPANPITDTRHATDGKQRSLDEQAYRGGLKNRQNPQHQMQQAIYSSAQRPNTNTLNQTINTSISGIIPSLDSTNIPHAPHLSDTSSVPLVIGSKDRNIAPSRPSISGPMNGTPIPTGYNFGAKEEPSSTGSNNNTNASDTKKRFWHRFGGTSHDKNQPAKQVFGVTLAESIAVSNVTEGLELPSVVYRCIEYLESKDAASEEGIYRLSGSSAVIKNLRDRFNAQGDVNMLASSEPFYDPHAVAGLLKQFLRDLKDSVLTRDLHLDFLRVNELTDRRERVNELGHLISLLPLANYSLLRTLCNHLIKVIEKSDVNKMTMRNVGIVFSPTLGIPGGIFALLLTEFDWVFFTDANGEPAPKQLGMEEASELDPRIGTPNPFGEEQQRTEESSEGPSFQSNRRRHRNSSIAGDLLRSGDGKVLSNLNIRRDNRNSLCYNEAEAERLLGGPQGKHRLSSQREELEAAIANATIDMDAVEQYDDIDEGGGGELEYPVQPPMSPTQSAISSIQLHDQSSPRTAPRQLSKGSTLYTPQQFHYSQGISNSSSNLGESTSLRNVRSHSHNPKGGPLVQGGEFHSSSNSDGHS